MAGGFGTSKKFALNTKCLVVSGVLGLGYWYLPKKNYLLLGGILFSSYVGLAWYDELYNCDDRLKTGVLTPFTWWAKPEIVDGTYGAKDEE